MTFVQTNNLKEELGAVPFQCANFPVPSSFIELPNEGWSKDDFPLITESLVSDYLKAKEHFTKNFRTGVCLCQCGHVFNLEMANLIILVYKS